MTDSLGIQPRLSSESTSSESVSPQVAALRSRQLVFDGDAADGGGGADEIASDGGYADEEEAVAATVVTT